MIKYPSVKGTVGKRARIRIKPQEREQKKQAGFLVRLFGQKFRQRPEMNFLQIFATVSNLQTPLEQCAVAHELSMRWGAIFFILGSSFFLLVFSMPLYMINTFLGMYTKRGYIRVWDMAPIFRGIGFSVALFQMTMELIHISMTSLGFIFIATAITSGTYWKDCKYANATDMCTPVGSKVTSQEDCCEDKARSHNCTHSYIHYATSDFFRYYLIRDNGNMGLLEALRYMNWNWIIYVCVCWFIVFVFMVIGFQRFKKITTVMAIISLVSFCVPTFMLNIFASDYFVTPAMLSINLNDLYDLKYWAAVIKYAIIHQTPGSFITLGAFTSNSIKPESASVAIFAFKIFLTTMLVSYLSVAISIQKHLYDATGKYCFLLNGNEVVLAFSYDILVRLPVSPVFVIIWSLIISSWGILSPIFTMTCLADTLTDAYPKTKHYRVCVCAMLCLFGTACNCLILNPLYYVVIYTWMYKGQIVVFIGVMLAYFVAIFLYSVKNIATDYYFTYGTPLKRLWIVSFKFSCVVTLASFIIITFDSEKCIFIEFKSYVTVLVYIVAGVIISPIPIYMAYLYIKSQISKRRVLLFRCEPSFGPPDTQVRLARMQFNPESVVKYKLKTVKCKHTCLLNSKKIRDQIEKLNERRKMALERMKESDDDQSSISDH